MSNAALDDAIAQEVAYGLPLDVVATAHGLTPAGLRNRLKHIEDRVRHYQEQRSVVRMQVAAQLDEMIPASTALVREGLHNHQLPFKVRLDNAWKVIDRQAPVTTKSEVTNQVTLNVDNRTLTLFIDGFEKLQKMREGFEPNGPIEESPHLIESGKKDNGAGE